MLTGRIHSKEHGYEDKQVPHKEKYLNLLKYVFRVKYHHDHFVEVFSKYKTDLLIFSRSEVGQRGPGFLACPVVSTT